MSPTRSALLTLVTAAVLIGAAVTPASASPRPTPQAGSGRAHAGVPTAVAAGYPAPVPAGYSVHGVDVSNNNGTIDWAAVKASGASFSYAKASEGTYYRDETYSTNTNGARGAGLYAGAYHFANPADSSGAAQADYFLDTIAYKPGALTLPPFLDLEPGNIIGESDCYGLSSSGMVGWITDFANEVQARIGKKIVLYTGTGFWDSCVGTGDFADYPLDMARYSDSPYPLPGGWKDFAFWQYTDSSTTVNCNCGSIDGDVFNGSASELAAFAGGASTGGTNGLLKNAGFNLPTNGQYWSAGSGTNFQVYDASASPVVKPYEGTRFAAANTSVTNGSIFQDVPLTVSAGNTYCVTARVTTTSSAGGGRTNLALWGTGGTSNENSATTITGLPGDGTWQQVQTCFTATTSHTALRVQFYLTPNTPTVAFDAVDLTTDLARNGGFNLSGGNQYWSRDSGTNFQIYGRTSTGVLQPFEGSQFAAANTSVTNGSIYQDIPLSVAAGSTYCVNARVTTTSTGGGGRTNLALWGTGGSTAENASQLVTSLPGSGNWRLVQTCFTAQTAHTGLRVQFYLTPNTPTVAFDAVQVTANLAKNAGFNLPTGSQYWSRAGNANFAVFDSSTTPGPFEGTKFAATNSTTATGSILQDIPLSVAAGATYCASVRVSSQSSAGGAGGVLALWGTGGSNENTSVAFNNLPGKGAWRLVQTCFTATAAHTALRVQIYPTPNATTLTVDDVRVD